MTAEGLMRKISDARSLKNFLGGIIKFKRSTEEVVKEGFLTGGVILEVYYECFLLHNKSAICTGFG